MQNASSSVGKHEVLLQRDNPHQMALSPEQEVSIYHSVLCPVLGYCLQALALALNGMQWKLSLR